MYTRALALRREHALGLGSVDWLPSPSDDVLVFRNGNVIVVANTGETAVELPAGDLLLSSETLIGRTLPGDTTAWLQA